MKNIIELDKRILILFLILAGTFIFIGSTATFQSNFEENPITVEYKGQFIPQTNTEGTTQSRMVFEVSNESNKTLIVTLKIKEKGDKEWDEEVYIGPMSPSQVYIYPQKETYFNKPYIAVAEWK
jgi:hypothetical protein